MTGERITRRQAIRTAGIAAVAAVAGCTTTAETETASSTDTETTASATATPADTDGSVYSRVYRETIDSVVLVQTDTGQGTGFVVDDSHIVTNAHVVGNATTTDIRFHEGSWTGADVRGTDPHSDLAVCSVEGMPAEATGLSFVETEPTVGQEVVAIGNPYDLNGSLTTGVVSGVDRTIRAVSGYSIPDAIQTDAAANPGNSGGPLMSLDGRVVAVVTSKQGDNIAFGISAALTRRVVPELIETGDYDHAYMGVSFTTVTPAIAEANDLQQAQGILIVSVVDGGPADGVLQPSDDLAYVDGQRIRTGGDVLLAVDGTTVETTEDLMSYLALRTEPGETIELTVHRDGSRRTVDLELGTRPE